MVNSRLLLGFKHLTKVIWVAVAWVGGFTLFFFAYAMRDTNNELGFGLSLIATLIIGAFTSLGDCTVIGFLKAVPPETIVGWSSGTGIAGIFGSGFYLLFKSFNIPFNIVRPQ